MQNTSSALLLTHDFHNKHVLCIGNDNLIAHKITSLLKCGSKITLSCPDNELSSPLKSLVASNAEIHHIPRWIRAVDFQFNAQPHGIISLVICTLTNIARARFASEQSTKHGIPVFCELVPEYSTVDFISSFKCLSFQFGVSNGQCFSMEERIKRDLVASLDRYAISAMTNSIEIKKKMDSEQVYYFSYLIASLTYKEIAALKYDEAIESISRLQGQHKTMDTFKEDIIEKEPVVETRQKSSYFSISSYYNTAAVYYDIAKSNLEKARVEIIDALDPSKFHQKDSAPLKESEILETNSRRASISTSSQTEPEKNKLSFILDAKIPEFVPFVSKMDVSDVLEVGWNSVKDQFPCSVKQRVGGFLSSYLGLIV